MNYLSTLNQISPPATPSVTVIVTTYNRKNMLGETIDSILKQSYGDFELIIVDNFSNYDFLSYIESFNDDRIKPYQNKNNGIIAKNRNLGIKKSRGNYIAFCDDDDIWLPDKLNIQIDSISNAEPQVDICFTNFNYINDGNYAGEHKYKKWYKNLTFNKFILSNGCVALSSSIINRRVFEKVKEFSEDKNLISVEDYDYFARILKYFNGMYLETILLSYRLHSGSIQKANKNNIQKNIKVLNSIKNQVGINSLIYLIKLLKLKYNNAYYSNAN